MPRQAWATPRSRRWQHRSSSSAMRAAGRRWRSPSRAGSDSAAIRTTAVLDGDYYILNGEKIYVTFRRARRPGRGVGDASIAPRAGPRSSRSSWSAITRAESSSAWSTSSASARRTPPRSRLEDCRVPREGTCSPAPRSTPSRASRRDADVRQHTPRCRRYGRGAHPRMPGRGGRATSRRRSGRRLRRASPSQHAAAARLLCMEATMSARLLTLQAAWMADNRKPNSLQASMAKAKAGVSASTSRSAASSCAGSLGYSESRPAREVGPRREDP